MTRVFLPVPLPSSCGAARDFRYSDTFHANPIRHQRDFDAAITRRTPPERRLTLDLCLRDCSSPVDPPQDQRDLLRTGNLKGSSEAVGNTGVLRVALPVRRLEAHGRRPKDSDALGVRWVRDELSERNAMMAATLR